MWPDNETSQDLLGFQTHADLVRRLVTNSANLPCTVGLFGDWGGGKSSVLRMLERDLDPDDLASQATPAEKEAYRKVACLYFNGWLFEGYDDARAALLSSILKQLSDSKRFGASVKEHLGGLARDVDLIRVGRAVAPFGVAALVAQGIVPSGSAVALNGVIQAGLDAVQQTKTDIKNSKEKEKSEKALSDSGTNAAVRGFHDEFARMLQQSSIGTLVVLVDDLDRCTPEHLVDNLEAIKLFLSVPGTAFVIGTDDRMVRSAIARRYAGQETNTDADQEDSQPTNAGSVSDLVRDYLEKMIQVPYHLPRLFPSEVHSYMTLLYCQKELFQNNLSQCVAASAKKRKSDRTQAFALDDVCGILGASMPEALKQDLQMVEAIAPTLSDCLKGNPRQVKRFLNMLHMRLDVAAAEGITDMNRDMLAKLMTLEYSDVKRFQELYRWYASSSGVPTQIGSLENVASAEEEHVEGAQGLDAWLSDPFLQRWLSSDPSIGETDLRPYFWLSRDRLDILAGVRGVPTQVRDALKDLLSENSIKRQRGISATSDLSAGEKEQIGDLVVDHLRRHPESTAAFESVVGLAEKQLLDGPAALERAFRNADPIVIRAATAARIRALIATDKAYAASLRPISEKLMQVDTPGSRALRRSGSDRT